MKNFITYIFIAILFFACKKEDEIIETPSISFLSISPAIAQEYSDNIEITISYSDEDGDLGENNPDMVNLFVIDNRNYITYEFRIPELNPEGDQISIEGNFNIVINGTGITDNSSSQKVDYSIYIKDRDGNKSNTITTSKITIEN